EQLRPAMQVNQLSAALSTHRSTILGWRKGQTLANASALVAIAERVLGISPSRINDYFAEESPITLKELFLSPLSPKKEIEVLWSQFQALRPEDKIRFSQRAASEALKTLESLPDVKGGKVTLKRVYDVKPSYTVVLKEMYTDPPLSGHGFQKLAQRFRESLERRFGLQGLEYPVRSVRQILGLGEQESLPCSPNVLIALVEGRPGFYLQDADWEVLAQVCFRDDGISTFSGDVPGLKAWTINNGNGVSRGRGTPQ
ncbi:MAG TPA: hypothetical protein V6D33_08985, partial [Cyanophyceae cyanobacterium]